MAVREKKERSLGVSLQLKAHRCSTPKCALIRKPQRPGVHGKKRSRALSDFGKQIKEKQKFKVSYGIDEKNLRQLYVRAEKASGSTSDMFIQFLESRLDNVVYRLGFAGSRAMARKIVLQGHIFVNKQRVRSPGFSVRVKDLISIRPESQGKGIFKDFDEQLKSYEPPEWLAMNKEKREGMVVAVPKVESPFEISYLVESFSKK
jgi:small subunit ribosomal protein S4